MYSLSICLLHITLAFILFFLTNWIGKHAALLGLGYVSISLGIQDENAPVFNYVYKVLAPVVFMVLVATIFQKIGANDLNHSIYWLVIDYWILRFLVLAIRGRLRLLNWKEQIVYWISSIGIALLVYSFFDKVNLLPSPTSMIEELWLVIVLFLYNLLNKIHPSREKIAKRIDTYIKKKYSYFHSKYDHLFEGTSAFQKALLYSIMIYEDSNRPIIPRMFERILFRFSKTKHTYGIMQVMSDHVLSDEESILLAKQKVASDSQLIYKKQLATGIVYSAEHIAELIAQCYNPGDPSYGRRVCEVFSVVFASFVPPFNQKKGVRLKTIKKINMEPKRNK